MRFHLPPKLTAPWPPMLAEFANLSFETAASLAAKVEVSEPTVGRFCRAIGYSGFKDLLRDLQDRTKARED